MTSPVISWKGSVSIQGLHKIWYTNGNQIERDHDEHLKFPHIRAWRI